jgi:TAZ zinc finger
MEVIMTTTTTTSKKYVGIVFQGKEGNLVINSEKVIFRPSRTASDKEMPVARSWRWAAIDRLEILDPPRSNSIPHRSVKLKSKVAEHKAVTLEVHQDLLDDLVRDVNQRLSVSSNSSSLGVVEGSTAPVIKKKISFAQQQQQQHQPAATRRNSNLATNTNANTNPSPSSLKTTGGSTGRRASMPEQQPRPQRVAPKENTTTNPFLAMSLPLTPTNTNTATATAAAAAAANHQEGDDKPSPKGLTKIKASVKAAVKTTSSKIPLLLNNNNKTPQAQQKTQPETTTAATSFGTFEAETSILITEDQKSDESSPPILVSPIKRPLLGFLRPPTPRRNLSDEYKNEILMATKQLRHVPTTSNGITNSKPKAAPNKHHKETTTANHPKNKWTEKAPNNNYYLNNNSNKETDHRNKEPPPTKEKQTDTKIVANNRKNSILATPPTPNKPKAAATTVNNNNNNKGTTWTPPVDKIFTPPTGNKEKVDKETLSTSPQGRQQDKNIPPKFRQDIVFTPTQQEKGKIIMITAPNTNTDLLQLQVEDETSVSTICSSENRNHNDPRQQRPTSKKEGQQPPKTTTATTTTTTASQIWNPQAPENVFRMMILQHAANCPCARGQCEYEPTCSEYKKILAHILTCTEGDECSIEKCRSTKQFLLTVQLMKEFETNQQHAKEAKDFLVGVGAVAPLSFIQLPVGSAHSVLSDDQTWWSNDWGAVENDDDSD